MLRKCLLSFDMVRSKRRSMLRKYGTKDTEGPVGEEPAIGVRTCLNDLASNGSRPHMSFLQNWFSAQ